MPSPNYYWWQNPYYPVYPQYPQPYWYQQGWVCPKCQAVYSPTTPTCGRCKPGYYPPTTICSTEPPSSTS